MMTLNFKWRTSRNALSTTVSVNGVDLGYIMFCRNVADSHKPYLLILGLPGVKKTNHEKMDDAMNTAEELISEWFEKVMGHVDQ